MSDANLKSSEATLLKRKASHLKSLEPKASGESDYLYQVGDPKELVRIGQAFVEDYRNGIRSFAITSTDYKMSQQRLSMALACYFDSLFDLKILVVSDNLGTGMYEEISRCLEPFDRLLVETGESMKIQKFTKNFDFLCLKDFFGKEKHASEEKILSKMNIMLSDYDIIFWDLPTFNLHQKDFTLYEQCQLLFESLTVVVSQSSSKSHDVKKLSQHFSGFGVDVRGIQFDSPAKEAKTAAGKRWAVNS